MDGENYDNQVTPSQVTPESGDNLDTDTPEAGGTPQKNAEDYSFSRWQKEKGYKSPDDLGKAYGHSVKHIGTLESENARFRDYIKTSIPWIQYAERKYKEDQEKMQGNPNAAPADENPGGENPGVANPGQPDLRGMVKEVASELIGPQINKLSADVSRSNVKSILKNMREDKKRFPYMGPETEAEMNNVLQMTSRAFPVTEEGIRELYNAAVGRRLPSILKSFKDQVTDEISSNLESRKNGFIESDRVGETGTLKNAHKSIVDSIVNASYGKSQI
jgi:hypothetical protein